jgi:hypothetical protein
VKAFALDDVILAVYIEVLVGFGVGLGAAAPDLTARIFAHPVMVGSGRCCARS